MGRKKGKKSGGQTEKKATGGQPEKESAQKTEVSGEDHAGPYWPQQRKKRVEPALRSGGGDITVTRRETKTKALTETTGLCCWQEHTPGVPLQSSSQAPQSSAQKKGRPGGTRPDAAIPDKTLLPTPPPSQPPPPRVQGPWGQPKPSPSSQPPPPGVQGPWGQPQPSPPSQPPPPSGVHSPRGQPKPPPSSQPPPPGVQGPWGQPKPPPSSQQPPPPPGLQGPWGQPQHLVRPTGPAPGSLVAPGAVGPGGCTPLSQAQSSSPAPSEHMPGVPLQSPPPPPVEQVPRGQPRQVGRPARPAPGSSVAPGAIGPSGFPPPPSQAQSSSPAPSGFVKITADAGVAATSKGAALQIPKRKGCGTEGRRIRVETNYLSLDLSKLRNSVTYHYDVEFKPALPKRLLKHAMEEFRLKNFPNRHPAFDGRKNLYACHKLQEISDTVSVNDDESQRVKEFEVTIKYASQINMESLVTYMQTGSSVVPPQNAVQALDVVLRSARMSRGFVQVGRSFFSPPRGRVVDLGGGLELWHGVFQSAILGWKPFLNIDVAHKGFPKQQNVVKVIEEICGPPRAGNELDFRQKEDFLAFISGLKVEYMIPNNPSSKRIYRVKKIAECPAKLWFELENNKQITVQDYFTRIKGVQLRYLHLPCLDVGSEKRKVPIYLPPELCVITGSQVINNRKMNDKQTTALIRSAATSTDVRKKKIMDELRAVNINEDPCIREFGMSVGGKFEEVPARILDAPQLQYNKNVKCALPTGGKWWPSNFFACESLGTWMILTLDGSVREDALRNFGEQMQKMGRDLGMQIAPPLPPVTIHRPRPAQLESFFRQTKRDNVRLVVVVIPDKDSYVKVKQLAELTVGVLTQCIKSATMKYMKPATCSNILLKVNSKLNGINHILADVSKPRCLQSPAMIVGADVTHPPPGQERPSVAAVCASNDPLAFKYNIQIRLQPPRAEIIQDMEAIIKKHLLYFYKSTRQKPGRIIFYRDGVGEGHFLEVLRSEVSAIRRACASLEQGYEPSVTFLVVQKRHHTRFFPTSKADEDGKNRNVPAGTVVDSHITHPTELDFFLASHASIQGVTRPTKYHLLWNDDDKMTTDEIEQLTYYLCHLFSRCTRSVSYPAPTYNAHLAAYRAGVYLEGPTINLRNLENEQKKYFESEVLKKIITESPMYFV